MVANFEEMLNALGKFGFSSKPAGYSEDFEDGLEWLGLWHSAAETELLAFTCIGDTIVVDLDMVWSVTHGLGTLLKVAATVMSCHSARGRCYQIDCGDVSQFMDPRDFSIPWTDGVTSEVLQQDIDRYDRGDFLNNLTECIEAHK